MTVDIEKEFDSLLSRSFLLTCFKKFGLGHDYIRWVTLLLKSQESCIIDGGIATSYFNLEKGARQGDQFLRIFLFYVLNFYFCLLMLIIKYEACPINLSIHGLCR